MIGMGAAAALFLFVRVFARGPPDTMTKEYQEATNEYLKVCHTTVFPSIPDTLLIYSLPDMCCQY